MGGNNTGKEEMIELLLEEGFKGPAICGVMGISSYYFYEYVNSLKSKGKLEWYGRKPYTTNELNSMLKMSSMGYTTKEIAKRYGRKQVALAERLRREREKRGMQ